MILACQQQYSLHYIEAAPPSAHLINSDWLVRQTARRFLRAIDPRLDARDKKRSARQFVPAGVSAVDHARRVAIGRADPLGHCSGVVSRSRVTDTTASLIDWFEQTGWRAH